VRLIMAWLLTAAGMAALVYGVYLTAGPGPAWMAAGLGASGCGLFLVDIDPRRRGETATSTEAAELAAGMGIPGELAAAILAAVPARRAG
jgi:hypothetical protein